MPVRARFFSLLPVAPDRGVEVAERGVEPAERGVERGENCESKSLTEETERPEWGVAIKVLDVWVVVLMGECSSGFKLLLAEEESPEKLSAGTPAGRRDREEPAPDEPRLPVREPRAYLRSGIMGKLPMLAAGMLNSG